MSSLDPFISCLLTWWDLDKLCGESTGEVRIGGVECMTPLCVVHVHVCACGVRVHVCVCVPACSGWHPIFKSGADSLGKQAVYLKISVAPVSAQGKLGVEILGREPFAFSMLFGEGCIIFMCEGCGGGCCDSPSGQSCRGRAEF